MSHIKNYKRPVLPETENRESDSTNLTKLEDLKMPSIVSGDTSNPFKPLSDEMYQRVTPKKPAPPQDSLSSYERIFN
jgi:hypothetical protein